MAACTPAPAPHLAGLLRQEPQFETVLAAQPTVWINPRLGGAPSPASPTATDVDDAAARLERFAPLIARRFPQTAPTGGLIESPLVETPALRQALNERHGAQLAGRLLLKQDSHLAIAGSVKARGGIYEVLKHAEGLALAAGLLAPSDSYERLLEPDAQRLFGSHTVQVGSTGNLGMSIGIMAAALGFHAVVHMSADAKAWKKDLLRAAGVDVREYAGDYGAAVRAGRALSDADPASHFVDDENSRDLFLGYAVAARRLVPQLAALGVAVDENHPLFVYLPCGVGGAPGGITFGLKQVFGSNVHCFFVEPVQVPCMLLGMATRLHSGVCVQDAGLSGVTQADGLAVGRPSGFVGDVMEPLLSGVFTVDDDALPVYLRELYETEGIFVEPSAAAALAGPAHLMTEMPTREYLACRGLEDRLADATHIAWATGGSLMPVEERARWIEG